MLSLIHILFIRILTILLSSILVNNFVLSRFLGICPFLGVSKKVETAVGMGMAVTFVMAMASLITWLVQYYVLVPLGVGYMPVSYTHLKIDFYDSYEFGRFFTLDGFIMMTQRDEFIYHEMLVHVPMAVKPDVKDVYKRQTLPSVS